VKRKEILYLIVASVMLLMAGIIYAWSILKAPFAAEFGFSSTLLGLNFTITMCCFCLGGILGGLMRGRLPLRLNLLLSGALSAIGFLLSGWMTRPSAFQLYLFYGVFCGLGIGAAYNVVISSVLGWFPDKRATASGVLMMSFGASSLVLGSAISMLLRVSSRRAVYTSLALAMLAVFALGAAVLRPSPTTNAASGKSEGSDSTPGQMLKEGAFWRFYLFTILMSSVGSCAIAFAKDMALDAGAAENAAVFLAGALSVCNGLGRLLCGALYDRAGGKKTIVTAVLVTLGAAALLLASCLTHVCAVFVCGVLITGVSYGFMPPLTSAYIGRTFGSRYFSVNFAVSNTMLIFASSSATVGGILFGALGGYLPVYLMLLAFAAAGSLLGLGLKVQQAERAGSCVG